MTHVREHTHCRVCGSDRLETYLDRGVQPLANAFRKPDDHSPELTAPLVLARCLECGLSQLTVVVDRDVLYRHYLYESGHSEGWRAHCRSLAIDISTFGSSENPTVWDIACNDGTFLDACVDGGVIERVFGIDPALNLPAGPFPIIRDYWSVDLADDLSRVYGKPDYIVAQNVLGHVDDPVAFLQGIAKALAPDGRAIIECPHIGPLLENGAFDTVYHEHLSYWSLHPLMEAAGKAKLQVVSVEQFPDLHGGTWRYYLAHYPSEIPNAAELLRLMEWEAATLTPGAYADFGRVVKHTLERLAWLLVPHGPVHVYGASAKSTVLLNAIGSIACENIQAIYDDSPAKCGMVAPGTRIPVLLPPEDFSHVERLVIAAPNWKNEILVKVRARGFTGKAILPWYGVQVEEPCLASS